MCNSEEEYEDMIMKKAEKLIDDFKKENGFDDENMICLLQAVIEKLQEYLIEEKCKIN